MKNINEMESICRLEYDWDEDGAYPIPMESCHRALEIVENTNYNPFISPSAAGCVHLEYHNGQDFLSLDFYKSKTVVTIDKNEEISIKATLDLSEIVKIIEGFFEPYYVTANG